MSIFRSYIKKGNTLIDNNLTNNSQNPVTEISYGTENKQVSRYIFDLDLEPINKRINQNIINPSRITKHVLHLTNTIRHAEEYIGKKSYSLEIDRASSFDLEIFNVSEDWDEGSGYDFVYNDEVFPRPPEGASNWFYKKTNTPWNISGGSYQSGVTEILGIQNFEKGSENLEIDVTDYVNGRLGLSGFTGTTYGLGIKFIDDLEALETIYRQAVAFHTNKTHTFYEPYIETIIDDVIEDDRNYFYLDKDNKLFFHTKSGVTVNYVNIYDYQDNLISTLSGSSIISLGGNVYYIDFIVSSDDYPDAVMFKDVWNTTINGNEKEYEKEFYLISDDNFYNYEMSNDINLENYFCYFWGVREREKIISGDLRKIKLTIRELYPNQNNHTPLDFEYRVFINVGEDYELDVIPYTTVNRTSMGYEFDLDTSWLIPQDYKLEVRLKNGNYYKTMNYLNFTVISNTLRK